MDKFLRFMINAIEVLAWIMIIEGIILLVPTNIIFGGVILAAIVLVKETI